MNEMEMAHGLMENLFREAKKKKAKKIITATIALGETDEHEANEEEMSFWLRKFSKGTIAESAHWVFKIVHGEGAKLVSIETV